MSLAIPNTTATADYQTFGGGGIYRNGGYLFVGNGPVDVVLLKGERVGEVFEDGPFQLTAGYSPLDPAPRGPAIIGLKVRAAGGSLSSPPQQFYGALFDSTGIAAGTPFLGTLSPSGGLSPALPNMITGLINPSGGIDSGSGFTCNRTGVGNYVITYDTAFADRPLSVVTTVLYNVIVSASYINFVSAGALGITISDAAGTPVDQGFMFLSVAMQ